MEAKSKKKMSFLMMSIAVMLAAWPITTGLRITSDNPFTRMLREQLERYMRILPEDRLYVVTDKPFYAPGDDIWCSVFVRDGNSLKPSAKSELVEVDLINPKGAVEKKIRLVARKGVASGDFALPDDCAGGLYKLRAVTDWMKNEGEQNYFEKEIQVQEVLLPALKMNLDFEKKSYGAGDKVVALLEVTRNDGQAFSKQNFEYAISLQGKEVKKMKGITDELGRASVTFTLPLTLKSSDGLLNVLLPFEGSTESISRAIPLSVQNVQISFFPEGGDLVAGLPGRVAFKALNEFGKAADIDGELWSEQGKLITRLGTFHMGMGQFNLTPHAGTRYFVRVTRPAGIEKRFELPAALEKGYTLSTSIGQEAITVNIGSTHTDHLSVVAQMRGKILYTTSLPVTVGENSFSFGTSDFPMGVLQITLFDKKGIERAERLTFINSHKQLKVSLKSHKEKYQPREKVKLEVSVKDENGLPAPALLSMAVVNDQLLSFADDRSGNILSHLLLQADLAGKVEEPAFYFKKDEPRARQALDLLMMSSGWRRFTWERIMDDEEPVINYMGRKAIIGGTLHDAYAGKPMAGVKVKEIGGNRTWVSDSSGRITIKGHLLAEPLQLVVEKPDYYGTHITVSDYGDAYEWNLQPAFRKTQKRTVGNRVEVMEEEASMVQMVPQAASGMAGQPMMFEAKSSAKDRVMKVHPVKAAAPKVAPPQPGRIFRMAQQAVRDAEHVPDGGLYHRARVFPKLSYDQNEEVKTRSDFRNTVFWEPCLEVGKSGKRTIEFCLSDDITSFRVIAEGIASDGMVGRGEDVFFTELPFTLLTKMPSTLQGGDVVYIPITLKNNTSKPIGGVIDILLPPQISLIHEVEKVQTVMPGTVKPLMLACKVNQCTADTSIRVSFAACSQRDELVLPVKIRPGGFPVQYAFSGQQQNKQYSFELQHMVANSLSISVQAFPDVVSDLMTGVEGILAEPYGCFEQTSCTAYPNAMVLHYLRATGSDDGRLLARAGDLLDRGYKRLTTFETSTKGYEWFGASPAHEGLTAYGIMEFTDMKRAGQQVDEQMIDRTARWLMMHRDGKGGFAREKRALHDFGRISDQVMNAYIVFALADAGYQDLGREFAASALSAGDDAYLLALVANAAFKLGKSKEGNDALARLIKQQRDDGSFNGSTHSITYSQGRSLVIETTALSILAMLSSPAPELSRIDKALKSLVGMRDGSGTFSSTQGTILALKALTAFALYSKKTKESGVVAVYVDGRRAGERAFAAGTKEPIVLSGLEKFIEKGTTHNIRVVYEKTDHPLPYSVSVRYATSLPPSQDSCALALKAELMQTQVSVGETTRYRITLSNRKKTEVPSAIAVIGLPAGLSAQPWQLKSLQEKGIFDYYEITPGRLCIYYRGMAPADIREIDLDLKAECAGEFSFPASSAYLYYTNEYKTWARGGVVKVLQVAAK